jgi:outer membrane protein assembly factor BamB
MDDDVRALERAARAMPGDIAAGRRFARGLERVGDRAGFLAEVARLARAGDGEARIALRRWNPWSHVRGDGATGCSIRKAVRRVADVATARVASGVASRVLGATDRTLFLLVDDLCAVDVKSLALRWRSELTVQSAAGLSGDDLVVAYRGPRSSRNILKRLDETTGSVLREATIDGFCTNELWPLGDRAVIAVSADEGEARILGVDLGQRFGEVLWRETRLSGLRPHCVVSSHLYFVQWSNLLGREPETGRFVFEASSTVPNSLHHPFAADERGVLLKGARAIGKLFVEERDRAGAPRWSLEGNAQRDQVAITAEIALIARAADVGIGSPQEVVAVDRATGKVRWSLAAGPPERSVSIGGDVAYVTTADESGVTVLGLEIGDGRRIFETKIPANLAKTRRYGMDYRFEAELIPIEAALLVVYTSANETFVARLTG